MYVDQPGGYLLVWRKVELLAQGVLVLPAWRRRQHQSFAGQANPPGDAGFLEEPAGADLPRCIKGEAGKFQPVTVDHQPPLLVCDRNIHRLVILVEKHQSLGLQVVNVRLGVGWGHEPDPGQFLVVTEGGIGYTGHEFRPTAAKFSGDGVTAHDDGNCFHEYGHAGSLP